MRQPILLKSSHNQLNPIRAAFLTLMKIGIAASCRTTQKMTTAGIERSYNAPIAALPRNHASPCGRSLITRLPCTFQSLFVNPAYLM